MACFVGAVVVGAAFLVRSARHPEPVLDLTPLPVPVVQRGQRAPPLLYAMGFFAMLLGNILFLTGVWHYSILRAGLAVTPGPAGGGRRVRARRDGWPQRVGFRTVLLVGFAVFAGGLAWYASGIGARARLPRRAGCRRP